MCQKESKSRKKRLLLFVSLGCFVFFLLCCYASYFFAKNYYWHAPIALSKNDAVIYIPKGMAASQVIESLADEQIIEFPLLYRLFAEFYEGKIDFMSGEYKFINGQTNLALYNKLIEGDIEQRLVTIPEGLSSYEIVSMLRDMPSLSGEITEIPQEGSLLPESYAYHYGDKRQDIINRMKGDMKDFVEQHWPNRKEDLPIQTKKQALILASIVEKETSLEHERRDVAAVFINRLNKNMRLQADPTVIYGMTLGKRKLDRPLTRGDLRITTPFNTYRINGLPPTPIANPGKASILAVLNPSEVEYLYFVADGTGGHIFAKNLEQHNKNVQNWREIRDRQRNKIQ